MRIIDGKLVICVIVESLDDDIEAKDAELEAKGMRAFDSEDIGDDLWVWYMHRHALEKQAPLSIENNFDTVYEKLAMVDYPGAIRIPLDKKRVVLLDKAYARIQVRVPVDASIPVMPYIDWLAWVIHEFEKEGARTLIIPQVAGEIKVVEINDSESENAV